MTDTDEREDIRMVNPDRDSVRDVIAASKDLGYWVCIVDSTGDPVWYRCIGETLPGRWVVAYETDDPSHVVDESAVRSAVNVRWPDVGVQEPRPEGIDA